MPQAVTGADIGASGVRVLRLVRRDGQLEVGGAASTELPAVPGARKTGAKGEVEAAEDNPERLREIRTNLSSLLRKGPFRTGRSVMGLGGSSGLIRYLQVPPVPPWKMEMMMKYEVEEQSGSQERAAFDYRILDLPDVGGQLTVMLAMVQERRLRTLMDTGRRAGLPRGDIDLNTLGLYNAYFYGHGADENRTVLLVDIGAETLDIAVVNRGMLCFARSVPGGGARFTAAVAEVTGLTFEEAEKLKREKGVILPPERTESGDGPLLVADGGEEGKPDAAGEEAGDQAEDQAGAAGPESPLAPARGAVPALQKKISDALAQELGVLAGVLDSSVMYCRAQTKQAKLRPEEILISGGGSMLPGLVDALARRMRMRVSRMEPFRQVSLGGLSSREVEEISGEAPRYAVALGLAASRVMSDTVTLSMVPEDVKARRRFLDSGLWMWYAAASVLLIVGLLAWVPIRNESMLRKEKAKVNTLLERAQSDWRDFAGLYIETNRLRDEVRALEERVHSGRDIVQVMSLLKKSTGGRSPKDPFNNILLVEAGNRPPTLARPKPHERGQVLQKVRRVYIRGYAAARVERTGNEAAAERAASEKAVRLIDDYIRELEKRGKQTGIVSTVLDTIIDYPDKRLLEESRIARREFVLTIVLEEPGAAGPRGLAAKGGAK
ncbi:MAG: pilus assembly protein PilM [Planctomycetota bacterium]|jgi:type IV pilus assembly protein PilM